MPFRATPRRSRTLWTTATPDFSSLAIKPMVKLTEGFDIKVNVTGIAAGTDPADYTVTFWFGDDEGSAITEPLSRKSDNLFRVACPAATQLTVPVHVRVYYKSEAEPVQSLDYSVRDYCDSVIKDGKLSFLACNAMRYGTAAQLFFKVNTDNLANAGYDIGLPGSIFSRDKFLPDSFAAKKSGSSKMVKKVTTSLQLNSKTAINFHIATTCDDPALVPIAVDGKVIEDGAEVADYDTGATITRRTLADGRVLVQISGIAPKQLGHAYRLQLGIAEMNTHYKAGDLFTGGSFFNDPLTIDFSVLSYAHAKQHTDDMYDVCTTLYRLYRASNLFSYYY